MAGLRRRIEEVRDELDAICEEEDDAYENLPDPIRDSERGWAMRDAASALYGASVSLDEAIDSIEEACG